MTSRRFLDQAYTGTVMALLLLVSMLNGYIAMAIAAAVLLIGLILFPDMRRTGITVALIAAGVAILVVLFRPVM